MFKYFWDTERDETGETKFLVRQLNNLRTTTGRYGLDVRHLIKKVWTRSIRNYNSTFILHYCSTTDYCASSEFPAFRCIPTVGAESPYALDCTRQQGGLRCWCAQQTSPMCRDYPGLNLFWLPEYVSDMKMSGHYRNIPRPKYITSYVYTDTGLILTVKKW